MYCPKCGKENIENSRFCMKCGTQMPATSTTPAPVPTSRQNSHLTSHDKTVNASIPKLSNILQIITAIVVIIGFIFGIARWSDIQQYIWRQRIAGTWYDRSGIPTTFDLNGNFFAGGLIPTTGYYNFIDKDHIIIQTSGLLGGLTGNQVFIVTFNGSTMYWKNATLNTSYTFSKFTNQIPAIPTNNPKKELGLIVASFIGDNGIYILKSDGSIRRAFTQKSGHYWGPRIAPNGNQVIFTSDVNSKDSYQGDIYIINLDGSGLKQITFDGESENPSWSPDGLQIVFVKGLWDLYIMNSDGSNVKPLVESGTNPDWSPDGKKIVFKSWDCHGIATINPDGSELDCIFRTEGEGNSPSPRWSPDGKHITFEINLERIGIIDSDGSNLVELKVNIPNAEGADSPTWSPDGTQILFLCHTPNYNAQTCVTNSDGTNQFVLSEYGISSADWR